MHIYTDRMHACAHAGRNLLLLLSICGWDFIVRETSDRISEWAPTHLIRDNEFFIGKMGWDGARVRGSARGR